MTPKLQAYLSKRAEPVRYPLEGDSALEHPKAVIVIPALAEADNLPHTLESLAHCTPDLLAQTLIIVVVNNRDAAQVDADAIDNNQRTLAWLRTKPCPNLHIAYIDAASPGRELKPKEGVGAARKIGMDRAFACLLNTDSDSPLIICLDADTRVQPNYLEAVYRYAKRSDAWAGVIDYAHPLPEDPQEQAAIVSYELFLRYQHLALHGAKSPYAFHTIGSTIVCTPRAYAAVSGMNRRAAGEDFYFLQQLAKTGTIGFIRDTTVYPSARISWRVPFGTGKRVGRFIEATHEEYRVYHAESYAILKAWLSTVEAHLETTADELLKQAEAIHPELRHFLEHQAFAEHWPKLQHQAPNLDQLRAQFHRWFDGFKTLKLIHHLRDHTHPDQPTFEAYRAFSTHRKETTIPAIPESDTPPLPVQIEFLTHLRVAMRKLND